MGEARHRLRLAQQALLPLAVALARAQELDGDAAIELRIVGGVDDAHAARADVIEDDVAPDVGATRQQRAVCFGGERAVPDDGGTMRVVGIPLSHGANLSR